MTITTKFNINQTVYYKGLEYKVKTIRITAPTSVSPLHYIGPPTRAENGLTVHETDLTEEKPLGPLTLTAQERQEIAKIIKSLAVANDYVWKYVKVQETLDKLLTP